MGLSACQPVHARHRHGTGGQYDRGKTPLCRWRRLAAGLSLTVLAWPAHAETLRLAVYAAGLSRSGPGLMLAALEKGNDPQAEAALDTIVSARPDILLLTDLDWDWRGEALKALTTRLRAKGLDYAHSFAPQPNTGVDTGYDLDGNGRLAEPRDAHGYGTFTGQHGMALLSRRPILSEQAQDFSFLLWQDLPGANLEGLGLPNKAAEVLRLSSTAHWDVPVQTAAGPLHIWAYAATPPVFDGPEDRNGRRNADETAFWLRYLEGALPSQPAPAPFVLMGNANLDANRGDGLRPLMQSLLANPALQDPLGPQPTADFGNSVGTLRVDYILPAAHLNVVGQGILAPETAPPNLAGRLQEASNHWLVWVDIALP